MPGPETDVLFSLSSSDYAHWLTELLHLAIVYRSYQEVYASVRGKESEKSQSYDLRIRRTPTKSRNFGSPQHRDSRDTYAGDLSILASCLLGVNIECSSFDR